MSKRNGIDATAAEILRILAESPDTPETQARNALQQAAGAGGRGLRQQYLQQAQRHIARIDARRNPDVVQRLQADVLALQGRGGDTKVAHVTPGELVIPPSMQSPEMMRAIYGLARTHGVDPRSLFVGSGRNNINPHTGLMEFADDQQDSLPPLESVQNFHPSLDSPIPLPDVDSIVGPVDLGDVDAGPLVFQGDATYYNTGKITANGQPFDKNASAAAMRLPVRLGDTATVQLQQPPYTTITVPINDRGPFAADKQGHTIYDENGHAVPDPSRVIDLTERSFRDLVGDTRLGKVPVTVTVNPTSRRP